MALAALVLAFPLSGTVDVSLYRLRVESVVSPLALDVVPTSYTADQFPFRPRFAWAVAAAPGAPRGTTQRSTTKTITRRTAPRLRLAPSHGEVRWRGCKRARAHHP